MFPIRRLLPVLLGAALVLGVRPARAFDTQPHFDITHDALAAEGFGYTPIRVVQVSNWFNDLYENPTKNPYSGHAPWYLKQLAKLGGRQEQWSKALRDAAARAHFDSDSPLKNTAGVNAEWVRLALATRAAVRERADAGDIEGILAVMGISLHMVQDFYTHSNWVEPKGEAGYDGPGWSAKGTYGRFPTWFDIPVDERMKENVYCDGARGHGHWKSDGNDNLAKALNKDWAGRPYHLSAYFTAYVASRQWVRAMEGWLGNPGVWQQVKNFSNKHGTDLDHDSDGAFYVSFYAGHWNGNGEPALADDPGPGGSIDDLDAAIGNYFVPGATFKHRKTFFRSKWEEMILKIDDRSPRGDPIPVPSSKALRDGLEAVVVEITGIEEVDDRDIGPVDEADWYATATIAGQDYRSGFIHGHDDFDFTKKPYGPFTFIRVRPRNSELVTITLRLYDDDGGLTGGDDHCDISPVAGRKDLEIKYNRATRDITGDITANHSATVRGKGDGAVAEISLRVRTIQL